MNKIDTAKAISRLPFWAVLLICVAVIGPVYMFRENLLLSHVDTIMVLIILGLTGCMLIIELIAKFRFHFGYEEFMEKRRRDKHGRRMEQKSDGT